MKARHHVKANRIDRGRRFGIAATLVTVLLVAVTVGAIFAYNRMREAYHCQCVVTDMSRQVEIRAGRMVPASVIAEALGLRVGANLAEIDFEAKRKRMLERTPNLKSLSIVRHLPDRVSVVTEERVPVARLEVKGVRGISGKVVDTEGVVFGYRIGTEMLPVINQSKAGESQRGDRVSGHTLAALRFLEASRDPRFANIRPWEIDTTRTDFLIVTLSDSKLKILWDGMDESTPEARAVLEAKLDLLTKAMRSRSVDNVRIWNATMPDRVFADNQQP